MDFWIRPQLDFTLFHSNSCRGQCLSYLASIFRYFRILSVITLAPFERVDFRRLTFTFVEVRKLRKSPAGGTTIIYHVSHAPCRHSSLCEIQTYIHTYVFMCVYSRQYANEIDMHVLAVSEACKFSLIQAVSCVVAAAAGIFMCRCEHRIQGHLILFKIFHSAALIAGAGSVSSHIFHFYYVFSFFGFFFSFWIMHFQHKISCQRLVFTLHGELHQLLPCLHQCAWVIIIHVRYLINGKNEKK